ncbi:hypothetical protein [Lyngbya sp. PCC 8106]|uniref:hypothetical protein n=1 Tax=Lyngbya sp. (strain PCC 8106) TaxID=313612 RepID=UPI0000EA9B2E|nr:hypothetical protein [Lyngbya sp. PCC 8106]EAW35846.1 hypothetical protein L8106_02687 [Lyngbya sp. PCC 8106]
MLQLLHTYSSLKSVNSVLSRLKELEFRQKQDEESRENMDSDLFSLRVIGRIVKQTPGGIKTWFCLMSIAIILAIFSIDLSIRFSGIDKLNDFQKMNKILEDLQ